MSACGRGGDGGAGGAGGADGVHVKKIENTNQPTNQPRTRNLLPYLYDERDCRRHYHLLFMRLMPLFTQK